MSRSLPGLIGLGLVLFGLTACSALSPPLPPVSALPPLPPLPASAQTSTPSTPSALQASPAPAGLQLITPAAADSQTSEARLQLLGRTPAGAQVMVDGQAAAVFATGVFARDNIPLQLGLNRLQIQARLPDGRLLQQSLQVLRLPPPAAVSWPAQALYVDGSSLAPTELHLLAPGDSVEVTAHASAGQQVQAQLPGQAWVDLVETSRPGHYRARLAFEHAQEQAPQVLLLRVLPQPGGALAGQPPLLTSTPGAVGQWRRLPERLWQVSPQAPWPGAELSHGLHQVRLGGPFLTALVPGTLLQARARQGDQLQVLLAPGIEAWVPLTSVQPAPPGSALPQVHFSNLSLQAQGDQAVLTVPLSAPVPYSVELISASEGGPALDLHLYGAHHATTWISQRGPLPWVQHVSVHQAGPDHVRVRMHGAAGSTALPWGWQVERSAHALRLLVRAAPTVDPAAPLRGLRIALEAGHGGPGNLGAVGATSVPEKDVNRWAVQVMQAELEAAGAQVLLLREGDNNPPLRDRVQRALASGAQLYVAVHANASDSSRGALRVSGTSSYYKHGQSRALAAAIHRRMLTSSGLADFGLVGNFNYAPLRWTTAMPAALLELAFITHPGDEAQLLDPAFRQKTAVALRLAIEDFLLGR